jgi:oligosaccharide amylase
MARSVTVGNGNVLVGLDNRGQVRDLYYPFVGEANHVSGASGNFVHRVGVFVDGQMSWLDDAAWKVTVGCEEHTCVGSMFAENKSLGIRLASRDTVHNEHDVFLRHFTITNTGGKKREVKLFLAQQFRIYESRRGDTGYYDPRVRSIIHYKGETTLLVNAYANGKQFSEYNIGLFGIEGKEGTWLDAQDGKLENNPIEHGSVDSVLALTFTLAAGESQQAHYWIVCAPSISAAHTLDGLVIDETPEALITSTDSYWSAWLEKESLDMTVLPASLRTLYKRSLMIMRVHTDNRGGTIASSDTDMLHHGRDTYSYVWPRDGAMISLAFDQAGYRDVTRRFFEFMAKCQEPGGYLMHKYRSDGVLGSSWHPWMINGKAQLPIQEDETSSILFALWKHYEKFKDIEFIEDLYNSFIEPAAEFMCDYIEPTTGLPQASFDLWEEKYGTSTYTSASVYAGLMAAAKFAQLLGKAGPARSFEAVASRIKTAIGDVLFDKKSGTFVKHVLHTEDELEYDRVIDTSSLYALQLFEVFDLDDERVVSMVKAVENKLQLHGASKGFIRYEGDTYYKQRNADSPNPWVICTLWIARYYIATAKTKDDLKYPLELLEWTSSHASTSGTLSEQMQPDTREHLSASPLVWSHAEFVLASLAYVAKAEELGEK